MTTKEAVELITFNAPGSQAIPKTTTTTTTTTTTHLYYYYYYYYYYYNNNYYSPGKTWLSISYPSPPR